jgi:hypothetical protein
LGVERVNSWKVVSDLVEEDCTSFCLKHRKAEAHGENTASPTRKHSNHNRDDTLVAPDFFVCSWCILAKSGMAPGARAVAVLIGATRGWECGAERRNRVRRGLSTEERRPL